MKGFTREALLILPSLDIYEAKDSTEQAWFVRNILKVKQYLAQCGIQSHFLNSDTLANHIVEELNNPNWIATFNKEDVQYIRNNAYGLHHMPAGETELSEAFLKKARNEVPVPRGTSLDARFDFVHKRWKLTSSDLVNSFKFVVTFENKSKEEVKVKIGSIGDGRLIWRIPYSNGFKLEAHLSGQIFNMKAILPYENLYLPLEHWDISTLLEASQPIV